MSLVWLVFGIYFDDNENIVAHIIYGEFGKVGIDMYFNDYHLFLVPIFSYLSAIFKSIPVYGIWYIILNFTWIYAIFLFFIKNYGENNETTLLSLVTVFTFVSAIILPFIVFFHCIKLTVLLGIAALLITQTGIEKKERKTYYFGIFLFIIGLFTRMHSPVIMLGLFLVTKIALTKSINNHLKNFSPHIIASIIFIGWYQLFGFLTNNIGRYIEANYEYAILEKKSLLPLNVGSSIKDSIKYEALTHFFISDTNEFTISYLKNTVNASPDLNSIFSIKNITSSLSEIIDKSLQIKWTLVLFLITILCLLFNEKWNPRKVRKTLIILLVGFSIPYVLLLFLVDEMKLRFFAPYVVSCGLLILYEFLRGKYLSKKTLYIIAISSTVILVIIGIDTYQISKNEKELNKQRKLSAIEINEYSQNHPLISFIGADIPFVSNVLNRYPKIYFERIAYFDAGYLTYYSYLINRFNTLFGISPLDYYSIINLLESNKEIRLYCTVERLELIKNYFKIVYNYDFNYAEVENQPNFNLNGKVYRIL
jgi:hypothetical protein